MDNIIAFPEKKEPTLAGEATCLKCKYECVLAAPLGTSISECPECKCHSLYYKYPVQRNGEEWMCGCGCDLFRVSKDGIYCPNCGSWQEF